MKIDLSWKCPVCDEVYPDHDTASACIEDHGKGMDAAPVPVEDKLERAGHAQTNNGCGKGRGMTGFGWSVFRGIVFLAKLIGIGAAVIGLVAVVCWTAGTYLPYAPVELVLTPLATPGVGQNPLPEELRAFYRGTIWVIYVALMFAAIIWLAILGGFNLAGYINRLYETKQTGR